MKTIIAAAMAVSLVGCASVMNDTNYGMRIDTKTAEGRTIDGADCTLTNDYGSSNIKSGAKESVRRSSKDLDIVCTHPDQPPAKGTATSRANGAMAGNIIFGGVIGAVIDHNRGTAYTYPTWIELIFGQTLTFDRTDEKAGVPLKGAAAGAAHPSGMQLGQSNTSSQACVQQVPGANCR